MVGTDIEGVLRIIPNVFRVCDFGFEVEFTGGFELECLLAGGW